MNFKSLAAIVVVSGLSMAYGASAVKFGLFPYPQIVSIKHNSTEEVRSPYYYGKKSFFEVNGKEYPIVMVGDSITDQPDWNELLVHTDIANRGIGGDTTEGILLRMDSIYSTGAKKTFVMAGINDITHSKDIDIVFDNYKNILRLLNDRGMNPHIQSTLLTGKSMAKYNGEVLKLNQKLFEYAKENNIPYIDLNAVLSVNGFLADEFTTDGVHLTGKAYELWGREISQYMQSDI
ncbi:GDSL-type esterase/lipase family protein [Pseudomonas helleri]|uniref:GDSL-type esterase/lipase family protein n=1 Tax=Pseudomonas helleri TaxID=1608996 RepID=UPI00389A48F1